MAQDVSSLCRTTLGFIQRIDQKREEADQPYAERRRPQGCAEHVVNPDQRRPDSKFGQHPDETRAEHQTGRRMGMPRKQQRPAGKMFLESSRHAMCVNESGALRAQQNRIGR